MSVAERDPYTGHMTTGHDWNGIKELNTPVPVVLLLFLGAAFVFSVGYWIMMPAWPGLESYTRGLLGFDQRTTPGRTAGGGSAATPAMVTTPGGGLL